MCRTNQPYQSNKFGHPNNLVASWVGLITFFEHSFVLIIFPLKSIPEMGLYRLLVTPFRCLVHVYVCMYWDPPKMHNVTNYPRGVYGVSMTQDS